MTATALCPSRTWAVDTLHAASSRRLPDRASPADTGWRGGWPRWAVGVKRWLCRNRIDPALVVPSSIHHVPPGPSPDPPSTARPGHATPFSVASPQPCCLPPLGLSAVGCLWPRPECTPLASLVMHDTPRIANTDVFPCHRLHKAIRRVHSVVGRCSTTSRREQPVDGEQTTQPLCRSDARCAHGQRRR